jgi:lipoprotein-anchoring transpeptidase ErfK/SrfK
LPVAASRARRRAPILGAALAVALSVAPAAHAAPVALVAPPKATVAYVAHVLVPTVARRAPSLLAKAVSTVSTQTQWAHGPMRLLVLGSARVADGRLWLLVRLPERPNDAQGWIPADDAAVIATPWRIVVDLSAHTVAVIRGNALVRISGVVVGKPSTPTPTGLFAIYEIARQPGGSDLGPWALHLTAHSNVLFDYGGGPGRVALHGRAGDLLADPLGTDASHGCIRMDNDMVSWIAGHMQTGVPVVVVA